MVSGNVKLSMLSYIFCFVCSSRVGSSRSSSLIV